ncbi:sensor histidine kinase [Thermodesulforhabdus norvegica]|uniref:histidine kinase n=1 Tax=Thermodesulforhabdus norvegica TaxID=39841 RepID=A0A1I4SWR5_9BACT|nr:HAMP domain-containing sensor histidine kinase [Thermodesulforhabdus norvegica]SFM68881.1 Signal transduction histidine kinase [Thermodesulforhabdus norvegica]
MFRTIRAKILFITVVSLLFACSVSLIYVWQIMNISHMLLMTQKFEDLLNDILEVRRYEKNFLLYGDPRNLEEGFLYLQDTLKTVHELASDIDRVMGSGTYKTLVSKLGRYSEIIERGRIDKNIILESPDELRDLGKQLVDTANELVRRKREMIHKSFRRTAALPFVFLGVFVIVATLTINLVSQRLLKPLRLIEDTTERVAHGDFSPIPGSWMGNDEISRLIKAFNSMARELEINQEALIQSRKIAAIGTFTAGIAHELNNPLNNICLCADTLIEEYADDLPIEVRELVFDIIQQAERAADIVKNLLDFSRTEKLSLSCLDLREVIYKTYRLVKNQIMLAGIRFEMNIPEQFPQVLGHFRSLQQIFLNLFLNAIQAIENSGSIIVSASEESDEYVRVDVIDDGKGIKPEDLKHIFTPFYTTKGVGRGTGLGLSVTYSLVKKHGGHIEVQSEVGKGTTFSVFLKKCKSGKCEDDSQKNSDS